MRRTLEDVEADTAELVNVGVEDLGEEADLGRGHGVVVGEEELELEDAACVDQVNIDTYVVALSPEMGFRQESRVRFLSATFVRRLGGTVDLDIEVAKVLLVRHSADSRDTARKGVGVNNGCALHLVFGRGCISRFGH